MAIKHDWPLFGYQGFFRLDTLFERRQTFDQCNDISSRLDAVITQAIFVNVSPFSHSIQHRYICPPTMFDPVWLPSTSRLDRLLKVLRAALVVLLVSLSLAFTADGKRER